VAAARFDSSVFSDASCFDLREMTFLAAAAAEPANDLFVRAMEWASSWPR
jgi:hypothetical protein